MAAYRIVKLDDSWKGRTRQFRYRTDSYLDVQIVEERGVSRIEFRKKMFDAPVEKELEVSWMKITWRRRCCLPRWMTRSKLQAIWN